MSTPRLVITCGDVNGIGLRCLAAAVEQAPFHAELALLIDVDTLQQVMGEYGLPGEIEADVWRINSTSIRLHSIGAPVRLAPGMERDDAARAAIASLEAACDLVTSGAAQSMLTLPISKHALRRAGWPYPGQTEMIAAHAGAEPLMVLCTRTLHVALATIHVPIHQVAGLITIERIAQRINALHDHLRLRIGIDEPRIAVLGLNPHAGEHGEIGSEDDEIIRPAIEQCRMAGLNVNGPYPADGFFGFGAYAQYDGVLAMYHDQGLIPLKLLANGAGVNVTAGLSIIRTSPDHGTAYDRIRSADIDSASTRLAIEMAIEMANRSHLGLT
jgi:4-hydroxythreonine-4-phosphate dehydrogenase